MNDKVKIIIAFAIVAGMATAGWYFLRGSQVTKVEIAGVDQQITPIKEEVAESNDDSSVNIQANDSAGSSLEKEPIVIIDEKEEVATKSNRKLKIVSKLVNAGFQTSDGRKIDTIIIHSSYDAIGSDPYSISGIIQEYRDYGVSAHYLIGRDGTIYQLVQEKDVAYHAGVSTLPDGRTNVNASSLGIELVNTKTDQMTAQQYGALQSLMSDIKSRYEIKYVLGHNQIAPGRKDDPWNLDWDKLK